MESVETEVPRVASSGIVTMYSCCVKARGLGMTVITTVVVLVRLNLLWSYTNTLIVNTDSVTYTSLDLL